MSPDFWHGLAWCPFLFVVGFRIGEWLGKRHAAAAVELADAYMKKKDAEQRLERSVAAREGARAPGRHRQDREVN